MTNNVTALKTILSAIQEKGLERDVFMTMFRESNELAEQMSSDDCREVFVSVLHGASDVTVEALAEACGEYGLRLDDVIEYPYEDCVGLMADEMVRMGVFKMLQDVIGNGINDYWGRGVMLGLKYIAHIYHNEYTGNRDVVLYQMNEDGSPNLDVSVGLATVHPAYVALED